MKKDKEKYSLIFSAPHNGVNYEPVGYITKEEKYGKVILARKVLTNIHQSTDSNCESCMAIRTLIDNIISDMGGFLEEEKNDVQKER